MNGRTLDSSRWNLYVQLPPILTWAPHLTCHPLALVWYTAVMRMASVSVALTCSGLPRPGSDVARMVVLTTTVIGVFWVEGVEGEARPASGMGGRPDRNAQRVAVTTKMRASVDTLGFVDVWCANPFAQPMATGSKHLHWGNDRSSWGWTGGWVASEIGVPWSCLACCGYCRHHRGSRRRVAHMYLYGTAEHQFCAAGRLRVLEQNEHEEGYSNGTTGGHRSRSQGCQCGMQVLMPAGVTPFRGCCGAGASARHHPPISRSPPPARVRALGPQSNGAL